MTYSPASSAVVAEVRAELARQRHGIRWLETETGIPRSRLQRRLTSDSLKTDEMWLIARALGMTMTELASRAERAAA